MQAGVHMSGWVLMAWNEDRWGHLQPCSVPFVDSDPALVWWVCLCMGFSACLHCEQDTEQGLMGSSSQAPSKPGLRLNACASSVRPYGRLATCHRCTSCSLQSSCPTPTPGAGHHSISHTFEELQARVLGCRS